MFKQRFSPAIRRDMVLQAAAELAVSSGYLHISREDVALSAKVSPSCISYHFGSMDHLRGCLIEYAIQHERLPIIAQGLIAKDVRCTRAAPADLQRLALLWVTDPGAADALVQAKNYRVNA